ncbi:MAG: hypothetical protein QXW10_01650, partial [Candidatus Micrarchaeaceae archaeon]
FKAYIESNGIKPGKELVYSSVSNAERSGVYELIKGEGISNLLEKDQVRKEFRLMEEFLTGLSSGRSKYGISNVESALDEYAASTVIVNDSMLGDAAVQKLLAKAEAMHVKVFIINAKDDAGMQLQSFKGVACLSE